MAGKPLRGRRSMTMTTEHCSSLSSIGQRDETHDEQERSDDAAPMQFPSVARAAMAAPAAILFVVTSVAKIVAGIRGDGVAGHYQVRGSSSGEIDDNASGRVSLEHHHGHHHGHQQSSGNENSQEDASFDFYVYSMTYQPEFCKMNHEKFAGCHNPSEAWEGQLTIHGLWPNRSDGSWPSDCSDEKFDLSLLENFSDDLAQRWPNVKAPVSSPGHEAFWAHEWSKHGTCSGLTQRDYFMTALDLLLPTPSVVKEHYGSVVKTKELEEGYLGNDMAAFVCISGYLSEVRVCFEKLEDGSPGERVTCPAAILRADSCGDEIKIASFDAGTTVAVEWNGRNAPGVLDA